MPMKNDDAPQNVDDYLATISEPARSTLEKVRAVIRASVPREATETISYRIPMFKYNGMLIGVPPFKNSLQPVSGKHGRVQSLQKNSSPSTLPKARCNSSRQTLPYSAAEKIVKMRVAQNKAKNKG
jgi:hypothetical protein